MNWFTILLLLIASVLGPFFWPIVFLVVLVYFVGWWQTILLFVVMGVLYLLIGECVENEVFRKKAMKVLGVLIVAGGIGFVLWYLTCNVIYNRYELTVSLNKETPIENEPQSVYLESKDFTTHFLARSDSEAVVKAKPYAMRNARMFFGTSPKPSEISVTISLENNSKDCDYWLEKYTLPKELAKEINQELCKELNIKGEKEEPALVVIESADSLELDTL